MRARGGEKKGEGRETLFVCLLAWFCFIQGFFADHSSDWPRNVAVLYRAEWTPDSAMEATVFFCFVFFVKEMSEERRDFDGMRWQILYHCSCQLKESNICVCDRRYVQMKRLGIFLSVRLIVARMCKHPHQGTPAPSSGCCRRICVYPINIREDLVPKLSDSFSLCVCVCGCFQQRLCLYCLYSNIIDVSLVTFYNKVHISRCSTREQELTAE